MPKNLTKKEAVYEVIRQARKERVAKRDHSKCWLALMALGLNNVETDEVLHYLDLAKPDGTPYRR